MAGLSSYRSPSAAYTLALAGCKGQHRLYRSVTWTLGAPAQARRDGGS